jgi:hypothetical protein
MRFSKLLVAICAKDKTPKHVEIKAYPAIKLERSWMIAKLLLQTTIFVFAHLVSTSPWLLFIPFILGPHC